jgi:adenylate cyclase, class 2
MRHHGHMVQGGIETEIKIRIADPGSTIARLHKLGFRETVSRMFEANTLYDRLDGELRRSSVLLRLRQVGGKALLTWKGPAEAGPHKTRPEIETAVDSFHEMAQILERLGYASTFRYEKFRTEFARGSEGVVTLDETPIGNFLELEGLPEWIDRTAAELGFSPGDYILESYGRLYLADCERRHVEPTHMVFA